MNNQKTQIRDNKEAELELLISMPNLLNPIRHLTLGKCSGLFETSVLFLLKNGFKF